MPALWLTVETTQWKVAQSSHSGRRVETAAKRDLEASRLLERLLLLSAGLDRLRSRTEIVNTYAKAVQFRRDYQVIDQSLPGLRGFEIVRRDSPSA